MQSRRRTENGARRPAFAVSVGARLEGCPHDPSSMMEQDMSGRAMTIFAAVIGMAVALAGPAHADSWKHGKSHHYSRSFHAPGYYLPYRAAVRPLRILSAPAGLYGQAARSGMGLYTPLPLERYCRARGKAPAPESGRSSGANPLESHPRPRLGVSSLSPRADSRLKATPRCRKPGPIPPSRHARRRSCHRR